MTLGEKRYQAFLSSTYVDLQEERREVVQALLELRCFPIGMELFPAADEAAWKYICDVIDDSDYYILIIGGRYGSVDDAGISFTEREYDYAVSKKIPVLAFLHGEPGKIIAEKSESQPEAREKLERFREKVKKAKLCKYWTTAAELGGVVSRSLIQLMNRHPAVGWVRSDRVPDESAAQTINRLRTENDELKRQLQAHQGPPGAEELAQGEDKFMLHFTVFQHAGSEQLEYPNLIELSWNRIFLAIGTKFATSGGGRIDVPLVELIDRELHQNLPGHMATRLNLEDQNTIKIQLTALGLIEGRARVWRLTQYGKKKLLELKAIRRKQ